MPILDVEIITRPDDAVPADLARKIADRAGEVFGSPPGNTWVKVHPIAGEYYAENSEVLEEVSPIFVTVLKAALLSRDKLETEAAGLASALARVCGRPVENVHILYAPQGTGRVAFGGKLT